MIIILKHDIQPNQKSDIKDILTERGYKIKEIVGQEETILGAVGLSAMDPREVELLPGVEKVIPITKPYKLASRELKKEDTVVTVGSVKIGGNRLTMIAGPCAVESREQIMTSARLVKQAGAVILRGGAFKPRTSPYSFQGLKEEGLKYLQEAGKETGMPVLTEVVSTNDVKMMTKYIDIFQIGARNMQNFELLKEVGSTGFPVVLKRGLSATIEEWLMAAEYLLASGTEDVILCERGIRTFEPYTRNTLDLSAIPVVKKLSHLPVIVDPSHATGLRDKVAPMALAGIASGAHGLVIEVHPDPDKALSDGAQSLHPEQFVKLMSDIEALAPVLGREITRLPQGHISLVVDKESHISTGDNPYVAYQGERGAYSEKAAKSYFPEGSMEPLPCNEFKDIFEAIMKGKAPWGVIPLENSLAGPIQDNYDLLYQYPDVKIIGEIKVRVRHNLLVSKGTQLSDIKGVYSHPQALAQCRDFLEKNNLKAEAFYDTAGAAQMVSEKKDKTLAAIAGKEAAATYGLEILAEHIETNPQNYTRFAAIAREDSAEVKEYDKASLVMSLHDEAGALSRCLAVFSKYSLNLTKLESRPIHGKPWSYRFYIDLKLPEDMEVFNRMEEEMKSLTEEYRCLGLYKAAAI